MLSLEGNNVLTLINFKYESSRHVYASITVICLGDANNCNFIINNITGIGRRHYDVIDRS